MKILFIGDIMGKPGRKAVSALLPGLRTEYAPDIVIANVENLAHGKGVTEKTLQEIVSAGVDFCTSGNHIWSKGESQNLLSQPNGIVLRPANYPPQNTGKGYALVPVGSRQILIINLMGRVLMKEHLDCPFRAFDEILKTVKHKDIAAIFVDFHGEATSEKNVFGLYADGRASAVVGTHTHVQTADDQILPKGTAYITDVGMVGLKHSSVGINYEGILPSFLYQTPPKHEIADTGLVGFHAVVIDIDPDTQRATSIERIQKDIEV
ncbi:TIGR00282 family metallophosphoesterase [Candidatus Uhrbacteria bacterium]|nr:TIGR00282 family metallophosphoesterase [Candidatus Uhrbacteria bacterium]